MPDLPRPRLVLDTNTVMALWFFDDPALATLRSAIDARRVGLVARDDALDELRRVLAYRQFGARPQRQAAVLAGYAARVERLAPERSGEPPQVGGAHDPAEPLAPLLPNCRDRDDQKFLEIARDGGASHLVSRDKALLRLNRHRLVRPLFAIVTPEAFQRSLAGERDTSAA